MAVVQMTGVQMAVVQKTRVAKWQVYKKCNRGTKTSVRTLKHYIGVTVIEYRRGV
jgi:hypothetical protein